MNTVNNENVRIPRPEYPRPQFVRDNWKNLNGEWEYMTDRAMSGLERGYAQGGDFNEKIIVPFCRESELSGIGDKDFCACVWYRKKYEVTEEELSGKYRILLNIGACDFITELYVNGKYCQSHYGGSVSFTFDMTNALKVGENNITLRVVDDTRSPIQPTGKQSDRYYSFGCLYTRTTGIWQTVWTEVVPVAYIENAKYYTYIDNSALSAEIYTKNAEGMMVRAKAYYDGKLVGEAEGQVRNHVAKMYVKLSELHLWDVGDGQLYDLELTLGDDKVRSYFGMREIECREGIMYLNKRPVFQRLVLDQGFYPDGVYTAPTYEALCRDVDMSIEMGFNGARLHQKVFEPLFLDYCDRRGYIVWGEYGNWGLDASRKELFSNVIPEWLEVLKRDFNHPSIVGWCPLNETQANTDMQFRYIMADLTRAFDNTRMYIDASGWAHTEGLSDIYDLHDYNQDPVTFSERLMGVANGQKTNLHKHFHREENDYYSLLTFVSEYGGTWWSDEHKDGWGYGNSPKSKEELHERFKGLAEAIINNPAMGGLCYTQLTDVEQEQNGMYTYDRKPKFDSSFTRAVLSQKAAIEN